MCVNKTHNPCLSIVIPVFNREKEISRAIHSCLMQNFDDFEVVIVDDGSTDGTVKVITSFTDSRIILIKHDLNKGVCSARNTGIEHARGDWIVLLDSDDELIPGALATIGKRVQEVSQSIERLAFRYLRDDGTLLPDTLPETKVLDYKAYIQWVSKVTQSDFSNCIRKRAFLMVKFPDNRSFESIFHFNFASMFQTEIFEDIVAIVHTDAINRGNNLSIKELVEKIIETARDEAVSYDLIIETHGDALKEWAGELFKQLARNRFILHFLASNWRSGIYHAARYVKVNPLSISGWGGFVLGLMGKWVLAIVLAVKRRANDKIHLLGIRNYD